MNARPLRSALLIGLGLFVVFLAGFDHLAARERLVGAVAPHVEITITSVKDNTIYAGTTNLRSNGQGDHFFAGRNGQGVSVRGLLAFDLAESIPADATIVSATLRLHSSTPRGGAHAIHLHRVLANWGEGTSNAGSGEGGGAAATTGDATWLHTFFDTAEWATPGGDFAATASATTTVNAQGFYTWSSPALLADVQAWQADPDANFGWILLGNEESSGSARRFDSRENGIAANRPQLVIVYEALPDEDNVLYLPLVSGAP